MKLKQVTLHPSLSNTPEITLPIPWAPPVTIATFVSMDAN